jgi:two-component system chemotaxis response regulator CheY
MAANSNAPFGFTVNGERVVLVENRSQVDGAQPPSSMRVPAHEDGERSTGPAVRRAAVTGTRRRSGPILLVDDYEDARLTLRDALEDAGHSVIEAADGQQALNYLVSTEPQAALIILDLQMPVMDGWRFIELVNCYVKLSTIPIIVVTAASEPHLERIKHPAVCACLQAPYELATLLSLVDSCLHRDGAELSTETA